MFFYGSNSVARQDIYKGFFVNENNAGGFIRRSLKINNDMHIAVACVNFRACVHVDKNFFLLGQLVKIVHEVIFGEKLKDKAGLLLNQAVAVLRE